MGFCEVLTVVFVILKLMGIISWAWWCVLFPEMIAAVLYVLIVIGVMKQHSNIRRKVKDRLKTVESEMNGE